MNAIHNTSEDSDRDKIRKVAVKVLRIVVPMCVSAFLIVWLMRKVSIDYVIHIVKTECDFVWIALMMFITMVSHIIRGIRWGIQLRAAGVERMPVVAESVSIFGAYALNLLFPQLGEAWRCVYVSRRQRCPLSTVIGTDIGDRGSDAVVVMVLLAVAMIVARPAMMRFADHYALGGKIMHAIHEPLLWIGMLVCIATVVAVLIICRKNPKIQAVDAWIEKMWAGFKVIFTMKGRGMYVVLTLAIWTCYFFETYCCFFAFPFTLDLMSAPGMAAGFIPGLVVFVFGSMSMAIPSNGGLGPWNIAVMFALSLYGVGNAEGTAYSLVVWSFQSAMLIALGVFSAGYIIFDRRHDKKSASVRG